MSLKEKIRRLKCKVLNLVDELRPRLTGHINYLQKRYEKFDDRLSDVQKVRSQTQLRVLKHSIAMTGFENQGLSNNGSTPNIVTKEPRLFFGKFETQKPIDQIKDKFGNYFVEVDIIEELCVRMTTEEIDLIAEDPKFYFPETKDGKYDMMWDADKWNYIADRLTNRIPDAENKDSELIKVPELRRRLAVAMPLVSRPRSPRVLKRDQSAGVLKRPNSDWEQWILQRNLKIADYISEKESQKVSIQRTNKKLVNISIRQRLNEQRKILEQKMSKGEKNAFEKYKQMIEARKEKQLKALKNKQELEERLEKIRYNEEMAAMNKRLKELCKTTNQINERKRSPHLSPEATSS